ncbi:hypothetical protein EV589_1097 [Mycobacterium sp. BK558]|nr:hypothetical protein EV589_1097 [Mycobacterium sp. BK558]
MPESGKTSRRTDQLVIAALVVAVAALGIAVWAVMRTTADSDSTAAGDPPAAESKTQVCQAFDMVRNAVSLQTNADLGPDKVAKQAVAANARLATLGGGEFLLSRLNGSVPADLADAVRSFANDLTYIGMGQLAGAPANDPGQANRQKTAQATAVKIDTLCR